MPVKIGAHDTDIVRMFHNGKINGVSGHMFKLLWIQIDLTTLQRGLVKRGRTLL